jgi:hypothetical protein
MENIESSSSKLLGASNKRFLLPSIGQLLLYMLISLLLLTVLNIGKAWDYLNNTVLTPQGGLDRIIATKSPVLHGLLTSLSQSIILQVMFWTLVGCAVYIIIWFIKNIAINMLNDITADQYIHPHSYRRFRFWGGIFSRRIFFWFSAVILVLYLVTGTRVLLYMADLGYRFVINFQLAQSSLRLAEIVLATTGLIYLLVLLVHIAVNSWRLMYRDL